MSERSGDQFQDLKKMSEQSGFRSKKLQQNVRAERISDSRFRKFRNGTYLKIKDLNNNVSAERILVKTLERRGY